MKFQLTSQDVEELRSLHRQTSDRRIADRFKAVLMRNDGKTWEEIAKTLLLDDSTIRRYVDMYKQDGAEGLLVWECRGRKSLLSFEQKAELSRHLESHCYQQASDVVAYVKEVYGVTYTVDGITKVMRSLGFAYKKFSTVPAEANLEKQEEFIEEYKVLKESKETDEVILFADATHPNLETKLGKGWIKVGQRKEILASSGRQRINLLGAINLEDLENPLMQTYETINADSIIDFIDRLEEKYLAKKITFICDNAKYFHARRVRKRLKGSRVSFHFLPAYSPNLNPIERFWKFLSQYCFKGRYFANLKTFRDACFEFFENLPAYKEIMESWITDNFQKLDPQTAHSMG